MANRIDNVRLVAFFQNKDGNHNHLSDHRRPMLNTLLQVKERVVLEPGTNYYLPSLFCNAEVKYTKTTTQVKILNTTNKPVFSGGVKTN